MRGQSDVNITLYNNKKLFPHYKIFCFAFVTIKEKKNCYVLNYIN